MSKVESENMKDLSFEDALRELETTVTKIEAGELSLEESLKLYERGQKLAAFCGQQLEQAQLKVEQLSAEGEIVVIDE